MYPCSAHNEISASLSQLFSNRKGISVVFSQKQLFHDFRFISKNSNATTHVQKYLFTHHVVNAKRFTISLRNNCNEQRAYAKGDNYFSVTKFYSIIYK